MRRDAELPGYFVYWVRFAFVGVGAERCFVLVKYRAVNNNTLRNLVKNKSLHLYATRIR